MICVPPPGMVGARSAPPTLDRAAEARPLVAGAVEEFRSRPFSNRPAFILLFAGMTSLSTGRLDAARSHAREALTLTRRWLVAGLVAMTALCATPAGAESIRAGALEWTLAAGGGGSLPNKELETVTSFHLLPHLGYFVTGEIGDGALRGNFELLVEPTLIHLDASNSATVLGVAILPRWVFAASPRLRPYVEAGGGVLAGQVDLRQTNCDVNFVLEAGAGAMIFLAEHVALTLSARFHHVSNANRCGENDGINSIIGIVGVSYFVR
jgi:Lipid A 3-O-deacylase (PagL)